MSADLLDGIRTGDWLDAQTFPALKWAVPHVLPEGFGIFTGPPKAGKSWCVYGIALAVAGGKAALGKIATGYPRPVLVLALEDGDRRMQSRARHLLGEGVPIPANLHYLTAARAEHVTDIIGAWLDRYGHLAPLVVLDTLGKVMPPALPGEGAYQRDYRVGSHLKALADAHAGVCLLVIHHTRKAGSFDWMDSTSGTNGLNGAADFTVNLERARNENAGVLRVTGRDVSEAEYAVTSDQGRWAIDGNSITEAAAIAFQRRETHAISDRSAEVLAYVNQHPAGVSPKEVDQALGTSDARTYLPRLYKSGRIGKGSRGLYTPDASVASVAGESESNTATDATHVVEDLW